MPFCQKCGRQVEENASFCPNCGAPLTQQPQPEQPSQPTVPHYGQPKPPPNPSAGDMTRRFATLGYISAFLSLLIMPEIFGSVAIILGNYIRRKGGGSRVLIFGITGMIVGLFFTAYFSLLYLIP